MEEPKQKRILAEQFRMDLIENGTAILVQLGLRELSTAVAQEALSCILSITKTCTAFSNAPRMLVAHSESPASASDQQTFVAQGLVGGLVQRLAHENDISICVTQLELMCRLTHANAESQAEAVKQGAIATLKSALTNDDVELKSKVVRAISGITIGNSTASSRTERRRSC